MCGSIWASENILHGSSGEQSFLNSLTSVRVFTRMVSENSWCSLWVSSSLSWKANVTLIFSCLHIHEWTSLSSLDFLTEIRDFCYKDSIPGRKGQKKHYFHASRIRPSPQGIGHILCPGQTVESRMSCSNLDRLWNQAMSTNMKYMLRMGFLAVTSGCEEVSKFGVEMRFFIGFDNIATSLHCNLKLWASERTLSYAKPQCVGILLTLDIIQVTWPFDV